MAFEIKNPTLSNIIDFLRNQLGPLSVADDANIDGKTYGRRNGYWTEINTSGGGGESTNIGDEVYTSGDQLIINSASTQMQDFFGNIAPEFDNTISNSTNEIVMYDNKLFTLTEGHTAPATWENTTHVTTSINDILKNKVNISGDIMTGQLTTRASNISIQPNTGKGGQINLYAALNDSTHGSIFIDNYYGVARIGGTTSYDNISQSTQTSFLIRPFEKTFGDNYIYKGSLYSPAVVTESGEPKFRTKNTKVTQGTAPSNIEFVGTYGALDSNDNLLGYSGVYYSTNKNSVFRILARQKIDESTYDNYVDLYVNNDKSLAVGIPTNAKASWRNAIGFADSTWLPLTSSEFNGIIYYRKIGNIGYVLLPEITLTSVRDSSSWTVLTTLPPGYRPSLNGVATPILSRGASTNAILYVYANGKISITAQSGSTIATNLALYVCISYPIDQ